MTLGQKEWLERILILSEGVQQILQSFNPTDLVLEKAFVGLNKESALKLAQIRGALLALCACSSRRLFEYSPREIKSQITGFGAATKEQVAHMVQRFYPNLGLLRSFDQSDAVAIATCHALRHRSYPNARRP
jgi:crossover junction endodeoxyribonuclease RuvC